MTISVEILTGVQVSVITVRRVFKSERSSTSAIYLRLGGIFEAFRLSSESSSGSIDTGDVDDEKDNQ